MFAEFSSGKAFKQFFDSLIIVPKYISFQYPFHADTHKRNTKNLILVVLNTLEAQDHVCKGPKENFPKRASVASIFGESFVVGTGDTAVGPGIRSTFQSLFF